MAKAKYKEKEKDAPDRPHRPVARNDAYVVMLLITFFAILAGCVLMYLDHKEYAGKPLTKEVAPTPAKLGDGDGKAGDGKTPGQ